MRLKKVPAGDFFYDIYHSVIWDGLKRESIICYFCTHLKIFINY